MFSLIKKYRVSAVVLVINLLSIVNVSSQDIDSLSQKSYEELEAKFRAGAPDVRKTAFYAHYYLQRAKKEKDPIRIAQGYYLQCAIINIENPVILKYADSIIEITEDLNDKVFPAKGYFLRGFYYSKKNNYQKALESYELAYKYALSRENYVQLSDIMYSIGILKNAIGDYEEALADFKRYFQFIEERNRKSSYRRYKTDHLFALFALAETYNLNRKLDSAHIFTVEGITKSLEYNNTFYYYYFVMTSGITAYFKKDYQAAIDSLQKAVAHIRKDKELENLALCHIYIGKAYYGLNKLDKAMQNFHTADSVITNTSLGILREFHEFYEFLFSHYQKTDDKNNQLFYINRLLAVDSVLDVKHKYLNKTLNKKFETPRLLSEKQAIIDGLKKREKSTYIYTLVLFTTGVISLAIYLYRREKKFRRKFLELMEENKVDGNTRTEKIIEGLQKENIRTLDIPEKVANDILRKLNAFEDKALYLGKNLSQNKIAKKLNTNSSYLSKVVNFYKHKNFATYINDLRIDYVVEQLKEDKRLRSYTIKSIADEVGFNNVESFTKAFYKKTGIKPSYFIKNLISKDLK